MTTRYEHVGATDLHTEVYGPGTVLGNDAITNMAVTLEASSFVFVIEGGKDDLESALVEMLLKVRAYRPGPHPMELNGDLNFHCPDCGVTVDAESVEHFQKLICCDTDPEARRAYEKYNHVYHYDGPGNGYERYNHPWYCVRCSGTERSEPCTT